MDGFISDKSFEVSGSVVTGLNGNGRKFVPNDFVVTNWEELCPYYEALLVASLNSRQDLEQWLDQMNELDAVVKEDVAWRYIRMTCDTSNEDLATRYRYFMEEISPKISDYSDKINHKYYESPFRTGLSQTTEAESFRIFDKLIANQIELFRSENIPLESEISVKCQKYGAIIGAMTIEHKGEDLTIQKASSFLLSYDRPFRESIWKKISNRRTTDREQLDSLFNDLLQLRSQCALNAGMVSYSDYRFKELARFDYQRKDCEKFHQAIEKVVKPIYQNQLIRRREKLGIDTLKPWDTKVDIYGSEPLVPFHSGEELLEKTIALYQKLDSLVCNDNFSFAEKIITMKKMNHFDLASRIGKAPGGYNYPLHESGAPFIFMNAVGSQSDLKTMVHECGHAVHSFLMHPLRFNVFKDVPSEIAELASMSMELISMDAWDIFYHNPADLRRAKLQQLSGVLSILPWIAAVDTFQTWIYDNPTHSVKQRGDTWVEIYTRFHGNELNWTGIEQDLESSWHMQLHIFEVPFYYIEYGFAQLGALQVWKNYRENPSEGMKNYLQGLSLGYTKSIPDVYSAAGISFDFSEEMIRKLFDFVHSEIQLLESQNE